MSGGWSVGQGAAAPPHKKKQSCGCRTGSAVPNTSIIVIRTAFRPYVPGGLRTS